MIDESLLPPSVTAYLDQRNAATREATDNLIDLFVTLLREDPKLSQAYWTLMVESAIPPGAMARVLTELVLREARKKVEAR